MNVMLPRVAGLWLALFSVFCFFVGAGCQQPPCAAVLELRAQAAREGRVPSDEEVKKAEEECDPNPSPAPTDLPNNVDRFWVGSESEHVGNQLAVAHDLLGDGEEDLIIGGFTENYVVSVGATSGNLSNIADNVMDGEMVSAAGDLNNDSKTDLVVSDPYLHMTYVVFGPISEGVVFTASVADVIINAGGYGLLVADVTGDKKDDVIIGDYLMTLYEAPTVYIIPGWFIENTLVDAAQYPKISGVLGTFFGGNLQVLPDQTGDGINELVASAINYSNGNTNDEYVYVFNGRSDWAADPTPDIVFNGGSRNFGSSLTVGDLNCDGTVDLLVGATQAYDGYNGALYGFYGPFTKSAYGVADAAVEIHGDLEVDYFTLGYGATLSNFKGDSCLDLVVNAEGYTDGSLYMLEGPIRGNVDLTHVNPWVESAGFTGGYSLVTASDQDSNGYNEVVVGAPYYSYNGIPQTGAVYLLIN